MVVGIKETRLTMKKMTKQDEAKFRETVARCRSLEHQINLLIRELNDGLDILKQKTIIRLAEDYRQTKAVH